MYVHSTFACLTCFVASFSLDLRSAESSQSPEEDKTRDSNGPGHFSTDPCPEGERLYRPFLWWVGYHQPGIVTHMYMYMYMYIYPTASCTMYLYTYTATCTPRYAHVLLGTHMYS